MTETTATTATETLLAEEYRGHALAMVARSYPETSSEWTDHNGTVRVSVRPAFTDKYATIDGQVFRCPAGSPAQVAVKLRKMIDLDIADGELLPALERLVRNGYSEAAHELPAVVRPSVGTIAYVHAMGHMRRGQITKVTATKVEVAYTTASSVGRVFRKMAPIAGLKIEN